jgi:hypothetical protein
MEKWKFLTLPGLKFWPLGCPSHSQLLYRLRYPSSIQIPLPFKTQELKSSNILSIKIPYFHATKVNLIYTIFISFNKIIYSTQILQKSHGRYELRWLSLLQCCSLYKMKQNSCTCCL